MLDLFAFVYRNWQARIKQTVRQSYERKNEQKQNGSSSSKWCEVQPTFLCFKNYSNVYKEVSALSVTDQNLEAFSQ